MISFVKPIRYVERFDDQGCYFLTEKGQIKSVKIPYKKVVEKIVFLLLIIIHKCEKIDTMPLGWYVNFRYI